MSEAKYASGSFGNMIGLMKLDDFKISHPKLSADLKIIMQQRFSDVKNILKQKSPLLNTLSELHVNGFTDEQIWQQLEELNVREYKCVRSSIKNCLHNNSDSYLLTNQTSYNNNGLTRQKYDGDDSNNRRHDGQEDSREVHLEEVESDDEAIGYEMGGSESKLQPPAKHAPSAVDDDFFKLSEMEDFLNSEDDKAMRINERGDTEEISEIIDMFEDLSDAGESISDDSEGDDEEEGTRHIKKASDLLAKDFFRPPKTLTGDGKNKHGNHLQSKVNSKALKRDGSNKKILSSDYHENIKHQIAQIEEAAVTDKPWQLTGEVTADDRPQNSLLEEHLEFDHASKLPPVVTEETTKSLEDLIKQRIKDKAWDDVEKKIRLEEQPFQYRKRLALEQEKSKKSLGEIYEEEYVKKMKDDDGGEIKRDEKHVEIEKMINSLFHKLDALSNFHYTPRMPSTDVKIINNMPAITMEEVAPVHFSDTMHLAPEEIKEKNKGDLKGDEEKDKTDKLRSRRQKKKVQKVKRLHKEKKEKLVAKLNPGLGNKYSKAKVMEKLGNNATVAQDEESSSRSTKNPALKSSKAFFSQLQDEVTNHVKLKKARNKSQTNTPTSGKLFKL